MKCLVYSYVKVCISKAATVDIPGQMAFMASKELVSSLSHITSSENRRKLQIITQNNNIEFIVNTTRTINRHTPPAMFKCILFSGLMI